MRKWIFVATVCAPFLVACEPPPPIEVEYGKIYRITTSPAIHPSPRWPGEKRWFGCDSLELYRRIVDGEARYDTGDCRTFEPGEPIYMLSPSGSYNKYKSRVRIRRAAPRIIVTAEEMEAVKTANKPLDYMTLEEMDATYTGSRWRSVYINIEALQMGEE